MTHKSIPAERRRAGGVNDSLIRLSVGLEDPEDLIGDLRNTLHALFIKSRNYSSTLPTC